MQRRNPTIVCITGWILLTVQTPLQAGEADSPAGSPNLVRDVPDCVAKVSVDSSFAGYDTEVLSDGRWIAKGEEPKTEWGHPDRLGNGGNTWVSAV